MATYASVAELKDYIGPTDKPDALLGTFLESAESLINRFLGVDTVISSDVTERVTLCSDLADSDTLQYRFVLGKRPVTAIKKVNGTDYTGTNGTDFIVEHQRVVTFNDLSAYIAELKFDSFTIEYTAGYSTCPADIKLAEMILAAQSVGTAGSNAYQSYAIGDEKVTFKSRDDYETVKSLLASRKASR